MVKVLVTGGAGYIGAHLIKELQTIGAEFLVVDDFSRGLRQRLSSTQNIAQVNLCDLKAVQNCLRGKTFDAVFHLAGYMQARESSRIPKSYWENNFLATQNLLNSIANIESTKFIFSSSCSVYGNNASANEASSLNPLSVYAKTKIEAENEIKRVYQEATSNFTIFRFFNVIGCLETPFFCDVQNETLLPSASRLILQGQKPIVYGNNYATSDGFALRDFIDVRDLVRAMILPLNFELSGVHNLSSGQSTSIGTVVQILLEVSNSRIREVEIRERNPEDPPVVQALASEKVLNLGWFPHHKLRDSVENFWSVFSKYYKS